MVRILHILQTLNVCGGIENFVMNYYRHIDRENVQFDFLIHELSDDNFVDEVKELGGRVYLMPKFIIRNLYIIISKLHAFYNEYKEYNIIHCHMANAAPFHFYFARNEETRILHSHQPSGADKLTHRIRNYLLLKMANAMTDVRFASFQDSGVFLFGRQPFTIIKNAVEADVFKNSVSLRDSTRSRLGFNGRFVVGHVGRFAPVKNHEFLLDIIQKLITLNTNAILCLVGEGEKKNAIVNEILNRGLQANVVILDTCKNMEELYSSFDVFLLPSFYEGFGLVAVEAQYAGIHVIASENRVPVESKISNYLEFLPLENGTGAWVQKILEISENHEPIVFEREDYDIKFHAKTLENIYLELYSKNAKS